MSRFTQHALRFLATVRREPRSRRFLSFWLPILLGMVVLLTIIAVLQYRSTTELTGVKEFQVGKDVETRMIKWHLDLYGELAAICVALQVGPDSGAHDSWNDYLERYIKWSRARESKTSIVNLYSNPDLVQDVYVWESSQPTPRLFRFNKQTSTIDISVVRPELTKVLNRLRDKSGNLAEALHAWRSNEQSNAQSADFHGISESDSPRSSAMTGWQFDETLPIIAHPEVRDNDRAPVDWIIVVLSSDTIQRRILPELARRYFGGPNGLDFNVAVLATGESSRVIYSSEPGFGSQDNTEYDSVMNIFGPPPESIEGDFWQSIKNSESVRSEQWRSFSAPVWFPSIEYGTSQNSWILAVESRHGPLQAVVQKVRRQNLAISALVLILLAINMGIAAVVGFRAQTFADLQMNFVASMSHELRTPLSVLHAAAENIRDGVVLRHDNLENYGSLMISQTRQLTSHVDRILLYASIRSGKTHYNMHDLDVSELIQRVVVATAELVKENGCTLVQNVEPELPCVRGDVYALCSCLENLIANAVKYSAMDRHITVSATRFCTKNDEREIRISVRDHGIGISHSELASIFEPFYRSPAATMAQIHGTGLGLFVAKHIAEAMGGKLSVASEVGIGSVFTLHLQSRRPGSMNSEPLNQKPEEAM
jgi:signal transduction histidine kinase